MNYILQAEGFASYCRDNRKKISEKGRLLWYALFHVLNRRFWPEEAVTISKYELLAFFPASEESLRRASAELLVLGLIEYEPETRERDARYRMARLYEETDADAAEDAPGDAGAADGTVCGEAADDLRQSCGEAAPELRQTCGKAAANLPESCGNAGTEKESAGRILSLDRARARTCENKNPNAPPNENANGNADAAAASAAHDARAAPEGDRDGEARRRVMACAKECGFALSKRARGWLCELEGAYGAEWVCAAIERSARRGKCTIGYVQGILSRWKAAGGIDDAGARAPAREACVKSASYWGHFAGERTYTAAEDAAIFTDLFAEEREKSL